MYNWLGITCLGWKHAFCFFYPSVPPGLQSKSQALHQSQICDQGVSTYGSWVCQLYTAVLKVCDTHALHHWHQAVLFDVICCTLYVRFIELCSLDQEAETGHRRLTVEYKCTDAMTPRHSSTSCYHILMLLYCVPRLLKVNPLGRWFVPIYTFILKLLHFTW